MKKSSVKLYIYSIFVNKRRVKCLANINTEQRENFNSSIYFVAKLFQKSHSQEHWRLECTRHRGNKRQNSFVLIEKRTG